MAYEEAQDLAQPADSRAAAPSSLLNAAASAKALVEGAEYRVASALPRRMTDDMLAVALNVPTEALRTAFARIHGESIYRALLKMRVRLVDLTLKADPELSSRAVAQVCGFGYFGRFHQLYRRDTGRSPQARIERADDDALERARQAVAATVERVLLKPGVDPTVADQTERAVSTEVRSVEAGESSRNPALRS